MLFAKKKTVGGGGPVLSWASISHKHSTIIQKKGARDRINMHFTISRHGKASFGLWAR